MEHLWGKIQKKQSSNIIRYSLERYINSMNILIMWYKYIYIHIFLHFSTIVYNCKRKFHFIYNFHNNIYKGFVMYSYLQKFFLDHILSFNYHPPRYEELRRWTEHWTRTETLLFKYIYIWRLMKDYWLLTEQ